MAMPLKALIVDDDPDASAWLAYKFNEQFPDLEIVCRESPSLTGAFDLYFIDNDFHGKSLAADLAAAIRATNPPSLIVAFSARLDNQTLKMLVNAGCDGACEKSEPRDIELMMRIVSAYLNRRRCETQERSRYGLIGAIHSIRNLLHEWNRRLDVGRDVEFESTTSIETPTASLQPGATDEVTSASILCAASPAVR